VFLVLDLDQLMHCSTHWLGCPHQPCLKMNGTELHTTESMASFYNLHEVEKKCVVQKQFVIYHSYANTNNSMHKGEN
jgi:hypothetical protein